MAIMEARYSMAVQERRKYCSQLPAPIQFEKVPQWISIGASESYASGFGIWDSGIGIEHVCTMPFVCI